MKKKTDEENFDEAVAQAYRAWTPTGVPSDIAALFSEPALQQFRSSSSPNGAIFFHLLAALHRFTQQRPYTLPLSSTLPDMKSDTNSYIHLQNLYKRQAEQEKGLFKALIGEELSVDNETIDEFVKNAHGLRFFRGKQFAAIDGDREALGEQAIIDGFMKVANGGLNAVSGLQAYPKEVATHLALSALAGLQTKEPGATVTVEKLVKEAHEIVGPFEWQGEVAELLDNALGEV